MATVKILDQTRVQTEGSCVPFCGFMSSDFTSICTKKKEKKSIIYKLFLCIYVGTFKVRSELFIHSFIFYNCFILIKFVVDTEPIPGIYPGWDTRILSVQFAVKLSNQANYDLSL